MRETWCMVRGPSTSSSFNKPETILKALKTDTTCKHCFSNINGQAPAPGDLGKTRLIAGGLGQSLRICISS